MSMCQNATGLLLSLVNTEDPSFPPTRLVSQMMLKHALLTIPHKLCRFHLISYKWQLLCVTDLFHFHLFSFDFSFTQICDFSPLEHHLWIHEVKISFITDMWKCCQHEQTTALYWLMSRSSCQVSDCHPEKIFEIFVFIWHNVL